MKFEFEIPYIIGISLNRGTKKPRNPWLNSDKELIDTYHLLADGIGCQN
jgi:hypothetical protein